jgi:hypothetical protein
MGRDQTTFASIGPNTTQIGTRPLVLGTRRVHAEIRRGSRPLLSPPPKVLGRDVESANGSKCQPAVAKSEQARLGL